MRKHWNRSDELDSLQQLGEHKSRHQTGTNQAEIDADAHVQVRRRPPLDHPLAWVQAIALRVFEQLKPIERYLQPGQPDVHPPTPDAIRTLFVYQELPKTFWSYEKILELVNRKVLLPPLGMVTVAALLPQEWEMKLVDLKALTSVVWRQGIKRNTRTRFWRYMFGMARNNPALLEQFLSVLANNEHFLEYRSIVQQEIREQLESLPPEEPTATKELQPA